MISFRTILFDLDGTLIDSVGLILDSYHHTFAVHGIAPRTDEELLRSIGIPLRVQFASCSNDPAVIDALVATYREYNLTHHDNRVAAYAGVIDVVHTLKARGLKTGLVTSKTRQGALRGLRLVGLQDCLDVLVCCDEVTNPKPHREPVDTAVTRLNATSATTLFVGDSVHDMECGRAAGVRTAAALWGPFTREDLLPTKPDYWLHTPDDLRQLLRL